MLGRMILCASELRFAWGAGADELARLAADSGFDGLALGPWCARGDVARVAAAAAGAGLEMPVVAAPLPDRAPVAGKRAPFLVGREDDERRAAAAAFYATLEVAAPVGARVVTVGFGEVALGIAREAVARHFARRELGEDEPGEPKWRAACDERRALSERVMDACRASMDRILRSAEKHGATLAIEVAPVPWGAPSPREAAQLLNEYAGAPVGVVWDTARMSLLPTLGLPLSDERRAALVAAARVWRLHEAVGLDVGYLPGTGDPDEADAGSESPKRPAGALVVVSGAPSSSFEDVVAARCRVQ